ncbi:hypothetical protein NM208_g9312 [Fusarium decemcellulare]|uniref:Uncharacterized protein n=1 Tax=Fusarium decemcellulare TaxID=57161 RepID=A0ACC1S292_9HYPO|nr:hypothetical protein NM208_g9312 [Fusarium decemcellulare]
MSSTAEIRKTIEASLRHFILAYKDAAEQNDASLVNRNTTPDCTRHLLPVSLCTSLGAPADFVIDNAEYERLTAEDLLIGGASCMTSSDMVFHDGEVLVMEHTWALDFTEDGSKVKKVVEFCDQDSVHKLMAKAKQEKEKSQAK